MSFTLFRMNYFVVIREIFGEGSGNFPYIAYNNVPQGFAPYITDKPGKQSKVFIAVPRRNPGVPSTLNFIPIDDSKGPHFNPKVYSYPSFDFNELDVSISANSEESYQEEIQSSSFRPYPEGIYF